MIFLNSETGAFGVHLFSLPAQLGWLPTSEIVRIVTEGTCTIPGIIPDISPWKVYAEAPPPVAPPGQEAYEVAPVAGVQQWALRPTTKALVDQQAAKLADVASAYAAKVAAGFAYAGEVVALDDASLTRFTAMGATALGVLGGALPTWPDEYARGWIAVSNDRIPLATARDGLTLASAAGAYDGALIQHARDLKSDALASATPHDIDETAGWPANGG